MHGHSLFDAVGASQTLAAQVMVDTRFVVCILPRLAA